MKITNTNINLINICINQILATSNKLPGGIIFNFNRNIGLLKPHLEEINDTKNQIIDQYVDKDEKGKAKYKKQTAVQRELKEKPILSYTNKNMKIVNDEIKALFATELEIEFIKLPLSKFETLLLDTSKIPGLNVFIDYIINENN